MNAELTATIGRVLDEAVKLLNAYRAQAGTYHPTREKDAALANSGRIHAYGQFVGVISHLHNLAQAQKGQQVADTIAFYIPVYSYPPDDDVTNAYTVALFESRAHQLEVLQELAAML